MVSHQRYSPGMSTPRGEQTGSRTAAFVVAGFLGGALFWVATFGLIGFQGASAVVVVAWCTGVVWLLKKRQKDPAWDARPPGQR